MSLSPSSNLPTEVPGEPAWTTIIRPAGGTFDWRLGELWHARDLILLFVRRDFVSVYKQTVLGPLWHILQPLLTTLTFTVIFGKVAALPTDGAPPFLFYLTGTVIWTYFATCLGKTSNTFVGNAHLLGKAYFHRLAIPISVVLSTLISFAIQFVLFLGILLWHRVQGAAVAPSWAVLATPIWVLMLAGYGLGAGIVVSALTTRYRDLTHLVGFGVQLLMYATPVIYSSAAVPAKYRWLMAVNPLAPIIEAFRHAYLGGPPVGWPAHVYSVGCLVGLLGIGLALFSRVERTFMDTV